MVRIASSSCLVVLMLASAPASARNPVPETPAADFSLGEAVRLKTHNPRALTILNKALSEPSFWGDSWTRAYDDRWYDQLRLKSLPDGYVPMISGEGDEDIPHEVVADIVYYLNTALPRYMSGAKSVVNLGEGYDSEIGAPYRDSYYVLDLTVFYATYPQRMYRVHDEANNRTILWFEMLEPAWVEPTTWQKYQGKMATVNKSIDKRWAFNSMVPFGEVYGFFIVTPGDTRESRVTFVSKLAFGDDAGWIAKWGSQLPSVIKAGLKAGYGACVEIAKAEKRRRIKNPPAPKPVPALAPTDESGAQPADEVGVQ